MATSFAYCRLDQVEELVAFIRDHWSPDHILVKSRAFLDWQHRDEAQQRYNYLIALDSEVGIVGILGFIPTSRYDPAFAGHDETIWLTTWKARADFAHGIGLMLLRGLMVRTAPARIGTVGLNPATRSIYQALGFHTGKLTRNFLLNTAVKKPRLAHIPSDFRMTSNRAGAVENFERLEESDLANAANKLSFENTFPRRSGAYLINRYLRHPYYRYESYLAAGSNGQKALLITRLCFHDGASALRVVDAMGSPDVLAECGKAFDRLLANSGAEYLDFYSSFYSDALHRAGFGDVADHSGLVLPCYFEPFERSNVELNYSMLGEGGDISIFKGDADQDRPSSLPEIAP